jgi:hypothetical protein
MPACSSLDLVIEIPWPDADASVATADRTLPPSNATLDRVIFPKDVERPPISTIDLATRLLQSPAADRPMAVHTKMQASQFEWASTLRVAPSVAGIARRIVMIARTENTQRM